VYDAIVTRLPVDITSGDAITPGAIRYGFKTLFGEEKSITLWAYNIETLLGEKVETILRRGTLNSRLRDFYDVYILARTQKFSLYLFRQALWVNYQKEYAYAKEVAYIDVITALRDLLNI
jgi:predicted nucleotidyltransferase component of viral defense system